MSRSYRIASLTASLMLIVAGLGFVGAYGQVGMTCMPPVICGSSFPCYNVPNGMCEGKAYRWARVTGCNVSRCGGTGVLCNNDTDIPCSFSEMCVPGTSGNCDTLVCYTNFTVAGCVQ